MDRARWNTVVVGLALSSAIAGTAWAQSRATPITAGAPAQPLVVPANPALTLTIASATEVQIDASGGADRDAQLVLRRDGSWVAEDGDTGPGTDARLATWVTPGTYEVVVYEYQHRAMESTVTAIVPPPFTPVAQIAPGAPATTVSTPAGDWGRAASVEVSLMVTAPGTYHFDARSAMSQCAPEITIVRDSQYVDRISANIGGPAERNVQLSAGEHRIRLRDWTNRACSMALTVDPA